MTNQKFIEEKQKEELKPLTAEEHEFITEFLRDLYCNDQDCE